MAGVTKNNLIVKDNALIEASYRLELVQQRLILLAILEARSQLAPIQSGRLMRVSAASYMHHFKVTKQTAYKSMKAAAAGLFESEFRWDDVDENGHAVSFRSSWVSKIAHSASGSYVSFVLSDDVIPMITELERNFTSYDIKQVAQLESNYAIRLYEILIKWRSVGNTPLITVEKIRAGLGLSASAYSTMSNFKKRVLDLAVAQINEHTDICVSYEQEREGRVISGFSFQFEVKKERVVSASKPKKRASPVAYSDQIIEHLNMTRGAVSDLAGKMGFLPDHQLPDSLTALSPPKRANAMLHKLCSLEKWHELRPQLDAVGYTDLFK